ncbi:ATP-binding protein, partial [Chroococcidiopsis sp. CCALA 051]|uniref:ATP-binding protein n=1 Tax=Chroococcidiopsis sp. CCALA 051 TaxID=869949 RepID=UPI001E3FB0A0
CSKRHSIGSMAFLSTAKRQKLSEVLNLELTASTREQIVKQATKQLLEYKIDLLNKLYNIEFVPPPKVKLGGLELMQEAFQKFKVLLSPVAKQYNLRVPKGVMFVGPPGTGKSHAAKVCAQIMGVPLVLVDWGNFRSEGDRAEVKLQKLLKLADRLNQIVLYFDDLDKGFAGDDDLSRRLAGQLLTWMQERTSDVVVIASVNRMEWLPPELTRAGRFDYIYKVDLPNNGERHAIFKLHAARFDCRFRSGGDPFTEAEWRRLLKATNRCVGAEIQTIVERAAATTFYEMLATGEIDENCQPQLELTVEALLNERKQMNPLAIREADRVESMRHKADIQGLPSSPIDDSIYANGNVEIFR